MTSIIFTKNDTVTVGEITYSVDKFFKLLEREINQGAIYEFKQYYNRLIFTIIDVDDAKLYKYYIDLTQEDITEPEKYILNKLMLQASNPLVQAKREEYIFNIPKYKKLIKKIKQGRISDIYIENNVLHYEDMDENEESKFNLNSSLEVEVARKLINLFNTPECIEKHEKRKKNKIKPTYYWKQVFISQIKEKYTQKKSYVYWISACVGAVIGFISAFYYSASLDIASLKEFGVSLGLFFTPIILTPTLVKFIYPLIYSLLTTPFKSFEKARNYRYHLDLSKFKELEKDFKERKKSSIKVRKTRTVDYKQKVKRGLYLINQTVEQLELEDKKSILSQIYKELEAFQNRLKECEAKQKPSIVRYYKEWEYISFATYLESVQEYIDKKQNEKNLDETLETMKMRMLSRLKEEEPIELDSEGKGRIRTPKNQVQGMN